MRFVTSRHPSYQCKCIKVDYRAVYHLRTCRTGADLAILSLAQFSAYYSNVCNGYVMMHELVVRNDTGVVHDEACASRL